MAKVERVEKVVAALRRKAAQAKKDDGASVVVGYTQNYAIHVHETNRNYTEGNWKYLTGPLQRLKSELARIVRTAMQKGVRMVDALLLAGLRLQRESQREVPVDTGALKTSAFTEKE